MVGRLYFAVWYKSIAAISWRSLVFILMIFAVLLGPYSFAGDGHAQEHKSFSSMNHQEDPIKNDHSGVGHALAHCGSASCAPSYVGPISAFVTYLIICHRLQLSTANDAMLGSLNLDCDPPVPRDSISET